jgi:hypothetical protein
VPFLASSKMVDISFGQVLNLTFFDIGVEVKCESYVCFDILGAQHHNLVCINDGQGMKCPAESFIVYLSVCSLYGISKSDCNSFIFFVCD